MKQIVQNFLLFQIGWLTCVLGAANQMPWLAIVAVAVIVSIHLSQARAPVAEIILLLLATFIGIIWESVLTTSSLMQYESGFFVDGLAPYWLIALWPLFATTMNVSMRWLKNRVLMSVAFGAIGGPAAFYAGGQLGAVIFPDIVDSMIVLCIGWAILMPLMVHLATLFDGYQQEVSMA